MIDLDFTEEQDMLRDMMRGVCVQQAPLEKVRELEDDPDGIARELWQQLAELGICGLTIPERHGGSAMSLLDGVVVYEELGRSIAPVPHFVSCVLSAGALVRAGSTEQQSMLAGIANGATIITPAWLEPGNGFSPLGVQLEATPAGDGFVLSGTKVHVYFAKAADQLLVLARTADDDAAVDLFLVDPGAEGVTLTQKMSMSSDSQYQVDFDGVRVPTSARVGDAGSGWATWDAVMQDAAILAAAQGIGGADFALEITVEYAKVREQFDKPLGAFQALSHNMADAKTDLDGARYLVYEAAWAADRGDRQELAPMAKSIACRTYRETTAMAQQIFGGVGFTVEYDIQLYFRRAKQLQISWWDEKMCEERIADAILGAA